MNVLIKGRCNNYDSWREVFDGHKARAEVCDESRTWVGKVDDNHFIVMLFDVDMPKMQEMMSGPELEGLIKEHGIEQEMFAFSPMN